MDEYENGEMDNIVEAPYERGFLDKAMGKLKGNSKKKKFARGFIYGHGSTGYAIETVARLISKRETRDENYFTPAPAFLENDGSNSYKAGMALGMISNIPLGYFTLGLSAAAPHIAGFANRIHRKIKKGKKDGRY
ncbi:MAG: hypothetical protein HZB68_06000 [Candidatus Aenigmarchaeota archaeon]|nr:hypothetical protein [Candidatus Aenigmarchaeota archaeon]